MMDILLVDDSEFARRSMRSLVSSFREWTICDEADDGVQAIEKARRFHPQVVLMDISMPRMDGLAATRIIRRELPQTRVILVSQNEAAVVRRYAIEVGACAGITKTELTAKLRATIESAVAGRTVEGGADPDPSGLPPAGQIGDVRTQSSTAVGATRFVDGAHESEGRHRELIDLLPAAIYTTDADGTVTHFNPAAAELSGRTPQVGNDHWCTTWRLCRPDGSFLPHAECPMAIALKTGTPIRGAEIIAERPDGSRIWVAAYPTPILDESGQVIGGVNMLVDITERKRAELALRGSTERFETLINQAPLGVFLVDSEFRVRHLNPVARAAFGDMPEPVGRDFGEVFRAAWPKKFAERALRIFRQTLQTGKPFSMPELAEQRADRGVAEHYEWRVDRIPLPEGNYGLVCYFRDVSVQVRARQAIQESEERLRALAETLEAQVQERTRELQLRNAEIVKQAEQLGELSAHLLRAQDEERRRIARELHDSAGQTLTALGIEQSFVAGQLSETAPDLAEKMVEIRSLTAQLTQEIRTASYLLHPPLLDECGLSVALHWYIEGLAARSGLKIHLKMAKDFGRLPEEMEMSIFRVVQECLTNIHRHSGSPDAIIRIAHSKTDIRLEIEDHGQGMSSERLGEVRSQGAGVGIRGMHERVRQHHGEMSIESGSSGTKICARWPIAKTPSLADAAQAGAAS